MNCGLRIADCGLGTPDCGMQIADCGLRGLGFLLGVRRALWRSTFRFGREGGRAMRPARRSYRREIALTPVPLGRRRGEETASVMHRQRLETPVRRAGRTLRVAFSRTCLGLHAPLRSRLGFQSRLGLRRLGSLLGPTIPNAQSALHTPHSAIPRRRVSERGTAWFPTGRRFLRDPRSA